MKVLCAAYAPAGEGQKIQMPFSGKGVQKPIDLWFRGPPASSTLVKSERKTRTRAWEIEDSKPSQPRGTIMRRASRTPRSQLFPTSTSSTSVKLIPNRARKGEVPPSAIAHKAAFRARNASAIVRRRAAL
jgi:hypothetical protein